MTTDTRLLAPTDAELMDLGHECELDAIAFGRAVLAKWSTPPAVAGEPIGHLYCGGSYGDELEDWEIVADQHQCDKLNEHHGSLGKEAKLPIYTTPQPTQAQAEPKSGAKSFQTYGEANAYSKGYYAGKKAATQAQAGAMPLTVEQVTAAAKTLAACMDYPWDHMPAQGREEMRKHAQAVIEAAHGIKGGQHE